MNIFLILLCLLLILMLFKLVMPETFIDTGPRHVKLNQMDGVDYVDRMPPLWRGEGPCAVYPCPAVFEGDTVCWKCDWRETD